MKHSRINWFEVLFWGVIVLCVVGFCVGCEQKPAAAPVQSVVPHMRVPEGTPPGSTIEWEAVIDGGERKTSEQATGTGAGLRTDSDEAAAKFATSAPGVTLPGITGTGGDGATEFSVRRLQGAAGNPLLWVGIAGIVAAGVAIYFGLRRAAVISAVIGGAFICAAMLPAWGWVILSAAGAIAGGIYLWVEYKAKTTGDTSKSLVAAIDRLKGEYPDAYDRAKEMVSARIAGQPNETAQRRTIARVKEQL